MEKNLLSKKRKKMNTPNEEEVAEILLRLPTKSIFKFKTISKTWLKIINEPRFANAYKSSNGPPVLAGLFHVKHNHDLIFNPVNHRLKSPSFNHLPLNLRGRSVSKMSCSNGLLLLCTTDGRKIVYNPVTRRRLMIEEMTGNQEWYHAFGLTHDAKDNQVKAVFAYKLATDDMQMALEIHSFTQGNKIVGRGELPEHWQELIHTWQCRTKDIVFSVYCSKKNEWKSMRLVSKFSRFVCFDPEMMAGVSIGGDLYWMTLDKSVLCYNSESEAVEFISAPAASAGLEAKSMHCSANEILVYCARDSVTEEVVIWELSDQKTWVAKERVKLHGVDHFHFRMSKILYVCHEMQAVFFLTRVKEVYRIGASKEKLELICSLMLNSDQVAPYLMSPWPAALNGEEAWPPSSSSQSHSKHPALPPFYSHHGGKFHTQLTQWSITGTTESRKKLMTTFFNTRLEGNGLDSSKEVMYFSIGSPNITCRSCRPRVSSMTRDVSLLKLRSCGDGDGGDFEGGLRLRRG